MFQLKKYVLYFNIFQGILMMKNPYEFDGRSDSEIMPTGVSQTEIIRQRKLAIQEARKLGPKYLKLQSENSSAAKFSYL